ncbi:hemagglutinin protein [Pontimicrobium sp. MEBiC01747]
MIKNIVRLGILLLAFQMNAQSIERQVIGSAGTTLTNGTVSLDFTVGELAVSTITDGTTTLTQGFHQGTVALLIRVDPVVFLQGALLNNGGGNLMRDDLRSSYLPTTSPYSDGLTCASSVFNDGGTSGTGPVNDNIVDWVLVELRDANDNELIEASQSALLQRDGNVVGVDGVSPLEFNIATKSYYIAIKHRNHLSIMTSATVALSSGSATVDFTDVSNQITFGTDAQTTFGIPTGAVAMWAGDANQDGRLNYLGGLSDTPSIRAQVFNDPDNSVFGGPPVATYKSIGYYATDLNMDGFTVYSGADSDVLKLRNNIFNNPSNSVFGGPPVSTYIFTQQLPEGAN